MRGIGIFAGLLALLACTDGRRGLVVEPTPIEALAPTYSLPISCFQTFPSSPVTTGERVVLDASCSREGNEPILAFEWELGDGRRARGRVTEVRYDAAGEYDVRLSVHEESGQEDRSSRRIVVR